MTSASSRPAALTLGLSAVLGGSASFVARTLVAPLERVKLLLQTNVPDSYPARELGIRRSLRAIVAREGAVGLLRGHALQSVKVFAHGGVRFATFQALKLVGVERRRDAAQARIGRSFALGMAGGALAMGLTYPLDVLRTRLIVTKHPATGAVLGSGISLGRAVLRSDGLAGLFRGLPLSLAAKAAHAGVVFGVYSALATPGTAASVDARRAVPRAAVSGAVAAAFAQLVVFPLDSVRHRQQVAGQSFASVLRQAVRSEGVRGLYRGASLVALKVPTAAASFGLYEAASRVLQRWGFGLNHVDHAGMTD